MEHNRQLRNKPTCTWSINLQQRRGEEMVFLINDAGKTRQLHAKRKEKKRKKLYHYLTPYTKKTPNGLKT